MAKIDCPNISLPAWKGLVDQLGPEKAYAAYFRNGNEIPDLSKAHNDLSSRPGSYNGPADARPVEEQYKGLPASKGGKYISTDVARRIIPGYDPMNPTATNGVASEITEKAYTQALSDQTTKQVEMFAGGSGSGKSGMLAKITAPNTLIYDGLFSSKDSLDRLDRTVATGKPVALTYIHRPIEDAIGGMFRRARKDGATQPIVPADVVAKGHFNSADNFLQAYDKYKDNPNVSFRAFDNGRGEGKADFADSPIDFVRKLVADRPSREEYYERARSHPEVPGLSDADRATYLGARPVREAAPGQPEQGNAGGSVPDVPGAPGDRPAGDVAPGVDTPAPADQPPANAPQAPTQGGGEASHDGGRAGGSARGQPDSEGNAGVPGGPHGETPGVLQPGPAAGPGSLDASERSDVRSGAVSGAPGISPRSVAGGVPVVEFPVEKLKLSKDVPQFKANANERGVVEPLAGSYDRRGGGALQVWQRLNGDYEVISGRHRFDLGLRTGEKTLPVQIYRESEGFDKMSAARLDAELNIRDGNGSIADYSSYFRHSGITDADAQARGLLARTKGKTGFQIARDSSEDTFALHQAERLSDDAASSISRAAPGDAGLQGVGARAVLEGKSAAFAENLVQAARLRSGGSSGAESGDLFAFDDSAMKEMEAQAKRAQQAQQAIREQISAAQGAARNPVMAKKLGVDVKDPAAVQGRINKLKADLERWLHWPTQEDLVAKTRDPMFDPRSETAAFPGLVSGRAAEAWADDVIKSKAGQVSGGIDPEYIAAFAIKGAAIIERGIRDFASWSAEMVKEFPTLTADALQKIWAQVKANGAEVPDNPKPRPTAEDGTRFRSTPDTEREGQRAAGVDPTVDRQTYQVRAKSEARAAARVLIDLSGAEKAREMSRDPDSQLPQDIRGGIFIELAADADKRIREAKKPEERAAAIRDRQALSSSEAVENTGLGQRISMLGELNKNTRAGVTQEYLDQTDRRQQGEFGQDGQKAAGDFAKATNDINAGAVDPAIAAVKPRIAKVKLSGPIWDKYREDAATRLADLVESKAEPPKDKAPLQEFTQRIVEEIRGRIKGLLPNKEPVESASPLAILAEAMRNPEKYKQVVDSVRKEFVDRFGEGSPPVDLIDTELGNMDLRPYSNRILDQVTRQAHEEMQTSVAKIARTHWTKADRVNRDLAEALVTGLRLKPEDAHMLADDLQKRMDELTQAARSKAIWQLIERAQTPRAKKILSTLEKTVNLNNLGALTEATARDAVAKQLGLPHVDSADLDRLGQLADKVETAPNVAAKARATINLAKELRDLQRPGKWKDAIDTGFSMLYANLLFSKTIAVKSIADVTNTISRVGSAALANPLDAGTVVHAWLDSMGMGWEQAKSVIQRGKGGAGYSPEMGGYRSAGSDPWHLSGLEGKNLPLTGGRVPLPHKYVPRIYKAIESIFYYPAREAYARLVATKLLQKDGYRGAELRRKVRDTLGISPDQFQNFRLQAEREGFTGDDVGLRVGSLVEQHRVKNAPEASDQSQRFAEETVFKQEPKGIEGVIYRSGRDLASKVTIAGVPVLKPFMLFMKIPTNAFSMSAEYTPIGIKRALMGTRDAGTGERIPPTTQERNQMLIRGTAGSLMMGALVAAVVNKSNDGHFDVTGRGPSQPNKRKQLQQAGWIPYSFRVAGGPYISYAHSPLMIPLSFVGNVADMYRYEKETPQSDYLMGSRLAQAGMRSGFSVLDLPMLQGMSQLLDGIRGRSSVATFNRFLAGTATSTVLPKGLMEIDQAFDPKEYDPTPGRLGQLESQVPFARRLGEQQLGPTGEPLTYSPIQRFMSLEVPGIAKTLSDKGVFITNEPRPSIGSGNSKRPATAAEYQRYQKEAGAEILEKIRGAMPELNGMDQKRAQERVDQIVRDARYAARINLENAGTP